MKKVCCLFFLITRVSSLMKCLDIHSDFSDSWENSYNPAPSTTTNTLESSRSRCLILKVEEEKWVKLIKLVEIRVNDVRYGALSISLIVTGNKRAHSIGLNSSIFRLLSKLSGEWSLILMAFWRSSLMSHCSLDGLGSSCDTNFLKGNPLLIIIFFRTVSFTGFSWQVWFKVKVQLTDELWILDLSLHLGFLWKGDFDIFLSMFRLFFTHDTEAFSFKNSSHKFSLES